MNVVLIGAGRLATSLGPALLAAGHKVLQVFSRTEQSAHCLADKLQCAATSCLTDIMHGADIYIISVSDSALRKLLPQVVAGREDALFVHTAGSMPMSVFDASGASRVGVFYPMQTFSKERQVNFQELSLFIEAARPEDKRLLQQLAASLTTKVYVLDSDSRRYLHLAAVFACNFSNHCYALAGEVLQAHGIPFSTLLPLIDETVRKVHEISPRQAQTGPAIRNDRNVMNAQESLLADNPLWTNIYKLMSCSILQLEKDEKAAQLRKLSQIHD